MFDTLFEYWEANRLDDLGDMLSDLSPYTFKSDEYVSADPAEYADWKDAWAQIVGTDKDATPSQVFAVACTLLDYYADNLSYDLGESWSVLQKGLGIQPDEVAMAV
ncbi:MAG: hypothetical protein LBL86_07350 [Coriobacteriales bacterium]|nr:hypothetical protein [Coriobacteriales bacterium]